MAKTLKARIHACDYVAQSTPEPWNKRVLLSALLQTAIPEQQAKNLYANLCLGAATCGLFQRPQKHAAQLLL